MNDRRLLIATTNRGKVAEFKRLLTGLGLDVLGPDDLETEVPPCEEGGETFCENARIKAGHWHRWTGLASLADDSGLAVDALDGAPGIYSARFAGENATDKENTAHLLELLDTVEEPRLRGAAFLCCLALCRTDGGLITFKDSCRGIILPEPKGSGGFGYDPVFYYPRAGCTFAQLAQEEKNKVSHRARALMILRNWLKDNEL